MATAEQLLNEAQYAFQNISFGESPGNSRNRSRAKSLCTKIIRKYPGSMEAGEAHAVLRRLGEEAYTSQLNLYHRHESQAKHHSPSAATKIGRQHEHISQAKHHRPSSTSKIGRLHEHNNQAYDHRAKALERAKARTPVRDSQYSMRDDGTVEKLDWGGLIAVLLAMPRIALGIGAAAGIFLFGIFGPFLLLPLLVFFMFTGPFRQMLKPEQRKEMNAFVVRANEFIAQRRRG